MHLRLQVAGARQVYTKNRSKYSSGRMAAIIYRAYEFESLVSVTKMGLFH